MATWIPSRATVERYKCFRQDATLTIRPLTLLFGENNAGKSALLRLMRVLADSTERGLPSGLSSEALREANFKHLRSKPVRDNEPRSFEFALSWDDPAAPLRGLRLCFGEDPARSDGALMVRELEATLADGLGVDLVHKPLPAREDGARLYAGRRGDEEGYILWEGLVPVARDEPFPGPWSGALQIIGSSLGKWRGRVAWLCATRVPPQRLAKVKPPPQRPLLPDGSNAADFLEASRELRAACNRFLEPHLERSVGIQLHDLPTGRLYRTLLGSTAESPEPVDVDVLDAGEGPIHLLPVLLALEQLRMADAKGEARALLIEEPEAHVHPSLQRNLAEHIAGLAAGLGESRLIIETHSEHLLAGVQLQIARGALKPSDVALHWVGASDEPGMSEVFLAELDEEGRPSGLWPSGVFGDVSQVAREILKARRERGAR